VAIVAGSDKSLVIALVKPPPPPLPPPTTGTLELEVNPDDAMVGLDGKSIGTAKGFRQELAIGAHVLEISAPGHETRREAVNITAGSERTLSVVLTPVLAPPPAPTTGVLELEVSTPDAVLRLDGVEVGPAVGFRRELPAGNHGIEVAAQGYETIKQTIAINAGTEKSIVCALQKLPTIPSDVPIPAAPQTTGWLVVMVEPQDALIAIDGKRSSNGNPAREETKPGDHVIVAEGKGLVPQRVSVHLDAGETITLPIKLARVPVVPYRVRRPEDTSPMPVYSPAQQPAAPVAPPQTYHAPPPSAPAAAPKTMLAPP
jgi:hypothetical protein